MILQDQVNKWVCSNYIAKNLIKNSEEENSPTSSLDVCNVRIFPKIKVIQKLHLSLFSDLKKVAIMSSIIYLPRVP